MTFFESEVNATLVTKNSWALTSITWLRFEVRKIATELFEVPVAKYSPFGLFISKTN